jgi:hypothetical protein
MMRGKHGMACINDKVVGVRYAGEKDRHLHSERM